MQMLDRRIVPAAHRCGRSDYWIGRYCDTSFVSDGRSWFDLCWVPVDTAASVVGKLNQGLPTSAPTRKPSTDAAQGVPDAASRPGKGAVDDTTEMTWQTAIANGLSLHGVDPALQGIGRLWLPNFAVRGVTRRWAYKCSEGYTCVQKLHRDDDAHVFCMLDYGADVALAGKAWAHAVAQKLMLEPHPAEGKRGLEYVGITAGQIMAWYKDAPRTMRPPGWDERQTLPETSRQASTSSQASTSASQASASMPTRARSPRPRAGTLAAILEAAEARSARHDGAGGYESDADTEMICSLSDPLGRASPITATVDRIRAILAEDGHRFWLGGEPDPEEMDDLLTSASPNGDATAGQQNGAVQVVDPRTMRRRRKSKYFSWLLFFCVLMPLAMGKPPTP